MFGLEARLRGGRIGRDAEHDSIFLVELFYRVTKLVRLDGSAGRIGAGEEVEDDSLALKAGEPEGRGGIGLELDVGGRGAVSEHRVRVYRARRSRRDVFSLTFFAAGRSLPPDRPGRARPSSPARRKIPARWTCH